MWRIALAVGLAAAMAGSALAQECDTGQRSCQARCAFAFPGANEDAARTGCAARCAADRAQCQAGQALDQAGQALEAGRDQLQNQVVPFLADQAERLRQFRDGCIQRPSAPPENPVPPPSYYGPSGPPATRL